MFSGVALDHVDYDLREYEFKQDLLEKEWNMTLSDKRDAVVEYAIKLLSGYVDSDTYHFAFSQWYDENWDEYTSEFVEIVDLYNDVNFPLSDLSEDEVGLLLEVVEAALEASAEILYNMDICELLDGNTLMSELIGEVLE